MNKQVYRGAYSDSDMRARAPPRSTGLLNGHYDKKHGGKQARTGRTVVKLVTVFFVCTWMMLVYKHYNVSSFGVPGFPRDSSPNDGPGGRSQALTDSTGHGRQKAAAQDEDRSSRHSRHKKKHKKGVCTDSPLQEKEAFPEYGCDELEDMLGGKTKFLGSGYWREVRLAEYNGQELAIKTLRKSQEETKRNRERHRWEAVALDMVKDHPNVVHLLGLCDCDVVTEYFPNYMDVLLLGKGEDDSGKDLVLEEIPISEVIRMALEAARGLQALHEVPGGPIVHADLQPRQLLLDENRVVKINDLNRCRFMARDADGEPCPFKISKGNGVWRSPEEYAGESLTEKIDIYSMGNIFWAMLGRAAPFIRDDYYKGKVLKGERPFVDPSWHPEFVQLFKDMWKRKPSERPSAGEVVARLETMYAQLAPEARIA